MSYKAFISYSHVADGNLAPALQSGLQRIAKPFYRLRAMRVFRDETSLHLTPKLWNMIQQSVCDSENFILMASPLAADSKWVNDEVNEWLQLKNNVLDNFYVILTEGEISWDKEKNDFDWEKTTALPKILQGKFDAEPLYLDFRWARESEHLSLRNPRFLNSIGRLAAAIRNEPLDSIVGEDVRQHRVFRLITSGVIVALLFLVAATSYAAYYATLQTGIANEQKAEADRRRDDAITARNETKEALDRETKAREGETQAKELAETKRKEAEQATKNEKSARNQAEERRKQAEEATKNETIAKNQAEERRIQAEKSAESERAARKQVEEERDKANRLLYAANARLADSLFRDFDVQGFTNRLENSDSNHRGIEWGYLSQLTKGLVKFHDLPKEPIKNIAFTPDGKYLLTHLKSEKLLRWDVQTGLSEAIGPGSVNDFSFSPDKNSLVTCGLFCHRLEIWDISTSSWQKKYDIPTNGNESFTHVSFTSDRSEIITLSSYRGELKVQHWDIQTKTKKGKLITKSLGDHSQILEVTPIGQIIVEYGNNPKPFEDDAPSTVSMFDSTLNELVMIKDAPYFEKSHVISSAGGRRIAFHGFRSNRQTNRGSIYGVFVFDTKKIEDGLVALSDELVISEKLNNLRREMSFSEDGSLLSLVYDNGIRVINLETKEIVKEIPIEFISGNYGAPIALSFDGSYLAVNSDSKKQTLFQNVGNTILNPGSPTNNHLTLWRLTSRPEVFTFEDNKSISKCEYSDCLETANEDGSKLILQNDVGMWALWDTFNKKKKFTFTPTAITGDQKRYSIFSNDGAYFFTLVYYDDEHTDENGNLLQIWDTTKGKEVKLFSEPECKYISNPVFSSDGNLIAVLCKDGYIGVWNSKTGQKIRNIGNAIENDVLALKLSQNDKIISVVNSTGFEYYYDFETGSPLQPDQFSLEIQSPDGKWLVYGNKQNGYFLKNQTNKSAPPILLLEPSKFPLPSISFSRDSRLLNVFGTGDAASTKPVIFRKNLISMENVTSSFELSPKGEWFIEGSKSELYYTNTRTGEKKPIPQCFENPTFTSDEKRLITSCSDGTIKFWDLLSGQEVLGIKAHQSGIKKIFLSEEETYMLTVSDDEAKLWRMKF